MNNVLTDEEVSKIVQILSQYAPDGWTALMMKLVTDEVHTEVTTWAVAETNPKHGFHLDDDDRAVLDELIDCAWERSGRIWNQIEFSVTSSGDFEINAA